MSIQTEQPLPTHTPFLNSNSNQSHQHQPQENNNDYETQTPLDDVLASLEVLLTLLSFNQSSLLSFTVSWTTFAVVGVVAPLLALQVYDTDKNQIKGFEIGIVAFQTCLAAVSLICLSHNLQKYGLNRCAYFGNVTLFKGSIRLIILWVLSCFLLKTAREITHLAFVEHGSLWPSIAVLLALIVSWTYVSAISLSACVLFHLVCSLQLVHFDDYRKLLQREYDALVFMEEHIRLRFQLSKISHRFRIYLLLQFLVVTASQFVTLLPVSGFGGALTFISGGDFAVFTLVKVVGIIIVLHAATKISLRAQGIVSLASRWHALVTCTSDPSKLRYCASTGSLEAAKHLNSIFLDYSESDLDSSDYIVVPSNTQLASYMSSHHKRQAFVMYLQTNAGGISIFGWTVDRSLVNTNQGPLGLPGYYDKLSCCFLHFHYCFLHFPLHHRKSIPKWTFHNAMGTVGIQEVLPNKLIERAHKFYSSSSLPSYYQIGYKPWQFLKTRVMNNKYMKIHHAREQPLVLH
ncbi:hypothetical protein JHK84_032544 [Glycine max]|nr:hypothetical protein JHK85_032972 [Glycine max]KAG4995574.1 hypothetical protein JHK86_032401 [Glycine max]KAG5147001.1 hypothetical protein JHK84_032544 [Glycine max]